MSIVTASHARWENSPGRQLAYRAYCADPGLPVAELVRRIEAEHGLKLAVRTVQDWRQRDQWEKRRALERLADAEVSIPEMVRELRVAAPLAVAYVRKVMDGIEPPDPLRLRAADLLIRENRAILELTKDALLAPLPDANAALDYSAMSDEELRALAAEGRSSL